MFTFTLERQAVIYFTSLERHKGSDQLHKLKGRGNLTSHKEETRDGFFFPYVFQASFYL